MRQFGRLLGCPGSRHGKNPKTPIGSMVLTSLLESIPTWAYQGTPITPDAYDVQHRTKPAKRCDYADVGCNCRNPGIDIGNPSPAFPLYYTIRHCSDTEIRVALNLFYEKDGAIAWVDTTHFVSVELGHDL